jgi:regulator of protease activity HflC (stomatin/prohibitin superfamily)
MSLFFPVLIVFVIMFLASAIRILNEYERGVIFRLGRLIGSKGPGLIILIPIVDKLQKISLRLITLDVPPQDVITRDNVSVKVNAVLYFRVMEPNKAVVEVENFLYATSQLAQTTLRSVCGQAELDELLAEREKINIRLQEILDHQTDPWGIKVTNVEVKHIDLPDEMKRAMAKQAEAERERRAKVIHATGEFQAAAKLGEAADIIFDKPIALQLRYLQTLTEVASEKNSTTIFPIPIDLFKPFLRLAELAEKK